MFHYLINYANDGWLSIKAAWQGCLAHFSVGHLSVIHFPVALQVPLGVGPIASEGDRKMGDRKMSRNIASIQTFQKKGMRHGFFGNIRRLSRIYTLWNMCNTCHVPSVFFFNLVVFDLSPRPAEAGPWLTATPDFALFVNLRRTEGRENGAIFSVFHRAG
jgi:hypothetical protein